VVKIDLTTASNLANVQQCFSHNQLLKFNFSQDAKNGLFVGSSLCQKNLKKLKIKPHPARTLGKFRQNAAK